MPAHSFRIDPRSALIGGLACWAGAALIAWSVHSGHAQAIDQTGLLFWRDDTLQPEGSRRLLEGVRDITALGGVLLRNLFALAAIVALLFLRLRREAALLGLTIAGGWLLNSALKGLVGRARPEIVPHLTEAGGNSFPSGHSFNSAVVYIALALAFAAMSSRASVRRTIVCSALILSLVIAWSRVWLGVHWPTDVAAGWLGGAGWAFIASAVLHRPAAVTVAVVESATDRSNDPARQPLP